MEFKALENERWVWAKTFKGEYPNYLVSDMGRCWSIKRNKFIGGWIKKKNADYWCVCISNNGKPETPMIGRIMLISFDVPIPNHLKELPTNKLEAMHLDGNSKNNNLSNFAWGNRKENLNEENARRRNSEANKGRTPWNKGKNWYKTKPMTEENKKRLSEAHKGKHPTEETRMKMSEALTGKLGKCARRSKPILQYSKDGEFIREWDCAADVERELGISHSTICYCCKGKYKSAGGYIWRYA